MAHPVAPPPAAARALALLEGHGFESWFVGGCVRDSLLGLSPADWDLATAARPQDTLNCFSGFRCIETGKKHGTVTVLLGDAAVEITTFRADGAYPDHRRPAAVRFAATLGEDLSRRDLTVNAMAWHPVRGLADPFAGQADLSAGLLRCVGEPDRRFSEDALRILRCLRFAACLGFSIEGRTAQALSTQQALLSYVSAERVRAELDRLLCGPHADAVLTEYRAVLTAVLPLPEILPFLRALPPVPENRWAALLRPLGEETADAILRRLRCSNRQREAILLRLRWGDGPLPPAATMTVRDLKINGADLLTLGYKKGPALGQALRNLLDLVLSGSVPNQRKALLAALTSSPDKKGPSSASRP